MLVAIYHILKDGVVFKDLWSDHYNQFNKKRKINAYLNKLKALGWGGSCSCRISSLVKLKKYVTELERGSLHFFGYPESFVSE